MARRSRAGAAKTASTAAMLGFVGNAVTGKDCQKCGLSAVPALSTVKPCLALLGDGTRKDCQDCQQSLWLAGSVTGAGGTASTVHMWAV